LRPFGVRFGNPWEVIPVQCLFCESDGPFAIEHIIPAALGNDDLVLTDQVCANCNRYFGQKVEAPVLNKSPIAFWRAYLGIRRRDGRLPSIDLSQPNFSKGTFPNTHPKHDNGIGLTAHEDGTVSLDISNPDIVSQLQSGERMTFQLVFTPKLLFDLGRFLCKIGVELLCIDDPVKAREPKFSQSRQFARFGTHDALWPIFHFAEGNLRTLKQRQRDRDGIVEEVECYTYNLLEVSQKFTLLHLGTGLDQWVVCLNDPYPTPEIRTAFPNHKLDLIWYSPEEVRSSLGPRGNQHSPL
jgi:hypothetical protein